MQLAQALELDLPFYLSLGAFIMCPAPDLLDHQLSVSLFYGTPVMPRRVHWPVPCALAAVSPPTGPSTTARISPLAVRGSQITTNSQTSHGPV